MWVVLPLVLVLLVLGFLGARFVRSRLPSSVLLSEVEPSYGLSIMLLTFGALSVSRTVRLKAWLVTGWSLASWLVLVVVIEANSGS